MSVCVSGEVSHESGEPAFLCVVLNPHGIDLISGLAVPRLSLSHCYSVCVCVCVEVKAFVYTFSLFFLSVCPLVAVFKSLFVLFCVIL